jgi:uncharacterized membrane protein required for colicin V production
MSINVIDIILVACFVAIIGYGFFGGVIRLTFVLLSLYLALIVGGLFYIPLGAVLAQRVVALTTQTGQLVAFLLLMGGGTAVLAISFFKTFPTMRLPRALASLDQIGGAAVGALAATLACVILTFVMDFFFGMVTSTKESGIEITPLLLSLAEQNRVSFLVRFFVDLATPIFVFILPFFPNGLPAILETR